MPMLARRRSYFELGLLWFLYFSNSVMTSVFWVCENEVHREMETQETQTFCLRRLKLRHSKLNNAMDYITAMRPLKGINGILLCRTK